MGVGGQKEWHFKHLPRVAETFRSERTSEGPLAPWFSSGVPQAQSSLEAQDNKGWGPSRQASQAFPIPINITPLFLWSVIYILKGVSFEQREVLKNQLIWATAGCCRPGILPLPHYYAVVLARSTPDGMAPYGWQSPYYCRWYNNLPGPQTMGDTHHFDQGATLPVTSIEPKQQPPATIAHKVAPAPGLT